MTGTADTVENEKWRILLVSAPWPLFNRPSLPLGALKAYLGERIPNLEVVASHLFLDVARALGYARYQAVSRRVWRASSCARVSASDWFSSARRSSAARRDTLRWFR